MSSLQKEKSIGTEYETRQDRFYFETSFAAGWKHLLVRKQKGGFDQEIVWLNRAVLWAVVERNLGTERDFFWAI